MERGGGVVAGPPELTSSLAVGLGTPTPTRSVVVPRRTMSGGREVQPPADEAPLAGTVPQVKYPEPFTLNVVEGEVEAIPTLPPLVAKYAEPVEPICVVEA